jgi:hypothetical protein
VCASICSLKPSGANWRFFRATQIVRRAYLPDDDPQAIKTELWLLLAQFRGGRLFELRRDALPVPIEEHPDNEAHELDPIVDRFLELGWTMEQVQAEFLRFMRDHMENCRPQFMLAVAGGKCFNYAHAERKHLLRAQYRPKLWKELLASSGRFMVAMYERFAHFGFSDFDRHEEDKAFYRAEFIDMLARGQFHKAYQLLLVLGHSIGVIYAEMESTRFERARKYLYELVPEAFQKAYDAGRFGIAAALVQQFGDDACLSVDLIRRQIAEDFDAQLEAADEQYADMAELWHSGEADDALFESGRGKEWRDLRAEIEGIRRISATAMLAERQEQIRNVARIALDLDQPIRFEDAFAYYVAPQWPRFS